MKSVFEMLPDMVLLLSDRPKVENCRHVQFISSSVKGLMFFVTVGVRLGSDTGKYEALR